MSAAGLEAATDQIRQASDIVDVIGSYVQLRRAGSEHKGLCPFHDDRNPSMHVSPAKQIFKCFACGAGGDVFTFIQKREGVDFMQARIMLAERAGISLDPERSGRPSGPDKVKLARANQWALGYFRSALRDPENGRVAREYIERRGISPEMTETFGLGYAVDSFDGLLRAAGRAGMSPADLLAAGLIKQSRQGGYYDTFRHRLLFPIYDNLNRVIAFGGRTLGDDPAKYLNSPETVLFRKGSGLFGLHLAKQAISKAGLAVIVEGYTDCLMAHQHGFAHTVATLGTAMTEAQTNLLRRFCDAVVLLFDSDEAGQRAADRALAVTMTQQLDVRLARVPDGKDPCDYLVSAGPDAFSKVLNGATPALEYRWRQVMARFRDPGSAGDRRRAIEEFLADLGGWLASGSLDVIHGGLVANQVSKLLSLPAEHVYRHLAKTVAQRHGGRGGVAAETGAFRGRPQRQTEPAEQLAGRELLEVLLNAPEYYVEAADGFDLGVFSDSQLRAIADAVVELISSGAEFDVAKLIGDFEDPAYGARITELLACGSKRGNYAATVQGALQRLRRHRETSERADAIEKARDDEDEMLRRVGASESMRRDFIPAKAWPRC